MPTSRPTRPDRPSRPASARSAVPQQVRIIGGQWKRTPLPVADCADLRPTPDRVRETVFNWLRHLFDGAWERLDCLDLFAGSGALGFEAASRGARNVTLVESAAPAYHGLLAIKTKLAAESVRVVRGDAFRTLAQLASQQARFDLIFLDPPFRQDWYAQLLAACVPLMNQGGLLYVEAPAPLAEIVTDPASKAPWEIVREDRAGMVYYHLLRLVPHDGAAKAE